MRRVCVGVGRGLLQRYSPFPELVVHEVVSQRSIACLEGEDREGRHDLAFGVLRVEIQGSTQRQATLMESWEKVRQGGILQGGRVLGLPHSVD